MRGPSHRHRNNSVSCARARLYVLCVWTFLLGREILESLAPEPEREIAWRKPLISHAHLSSACCLAGSRARLPANKLHSPLDSLIERSSRSRSAWRTAHARTPDGPPASWSLSTDYALAFSLRSLRRSLRSTRRRTDARRGPVHATSRRFQHSGSAEYSRQLAHTNS